MQNEDLNRLKVVLVEKKQTNKWLQNNWENQLAQSLNGVAIPSNQIWLP